MTTEILTERMGSTLLITLSGPATRNALSPQVYAAGIELLNVADDDPSVRAVVITGAGGHFCGGGDLQRLAHNRQHDLPTQGAQIDAFQVPDPAESPGIHEAYRKIEQTPKEGCLHILRKFCFKMKLFEEWLELPDIKGDIDDSRNLVEPTMVARGPVRAKKAIKPEISASRTREIELRQKQYEYYRDLLLSFPRSHSDEAA